MKNLNSKLIKRVEILIWPLVGKLFLWGGCGHAFKGYDIAEIKDMCNSIRIPRRSGFLKYEIMTYTRM